MTDPTLAPSPTPPPAATSKPSKLAIVAVVLAGVGALFAIVPASSGIAWLLLIPAIVIGIVALVKKAQPRWAALVAVIVAPIAWLISIIVFLVAAAAGITGAINDARDDRPVPSSESSDVTEEEDAEPALPGIGDTVTSRDGVSFTVTSQTCGLTSIGESFLAETAKGEFCEIRFTVVNGTDDSLSLSSYDVKGKIGKAEYDTSSSNNRFGDDYFGTDVNPGLTADSVVYFDVPAGSTLESITYSGLLSFDTPLVIVLS